MPANSTNPKFLIIGIPPYKKFELVCALSEMGLTVAHYMIGGVLTADIININLRCGLRALHGIKADCLLQINATSARDGQGFFPDFDLVLLRRIVDDNNLKVVLTSGPAPEILSSIDRHGDLRQRLIKTDIPGLPAGVGAIDQDIIGWINGYFDAVRRLFSGSERFVEIDMSKQDAPLSLQSAVAATRPFSSKFLSAPQPQTSVLRFSDVAELETEFSMHLQQDSPHKSFRGRIGIRTPYNLQHAPVWRSFLALNYASTTAAQLSGKRATPITISCDFPLDQALVELYADRVRKYGHELVVECEVVDRTYELPSKGTALSFGGGKESRLTYGLLRERGESDLVVCTTDPHYPHADIPEIVRVEMIGTDNLEIRLLPAFMMRPANWYLGGALADANRQSPWQYYFDYGSPAERDELADAFRKLGYAVEMHSPVSVLPSNICQKILCERYPQIAQEQRSTAFNSKNEKTLFVALLLLYNGFSISNVVELDILAEMGNQYIEIFKSGNFGPSNMREPYHREAMAILRYLDETGRLPFKPQSEIPAEWRARWINYIHAYVDPNVASDFMDIFTQYAAIADRAELDYVLPT